MCIKVYAGQYSNISQKSNIFSYIYTTRKSLLAKYYYHLIPIGFSVFVGIFFWGGGERGEGGGGWWNDFLLKKKNATSKA